MAQLLVQLVGHRQHFVATLRQQDNELVAPQPCHQILFAHAVAHPLGHHIEQDIPGLMAEGVVDRLEVIEIDKHQCQRTGHLLLHQFLEPLLQQATIGQPGEGVVEGEAAHHLLPRCPLGDIPGDPEDCLRLGIVVAMQGGDGFGGHQMAILVAQLGANDPAGLVMFSPLPGLQGGGDLLAQQLP